MISLRLNRERDEVPIVAEALGLGPVGSGLKDVIGPKSPLLPPQYIFIMGDNEKHENKAIRKSISLETKMQVIRRLDNGERLSQIGAALNLATSTIRTILKNKKNIVIGNCN
ncbi:hypothetical protein TNCV_4991181 [Trichonephila clavipes]|nr:hypothetical protein TNCV_4991181 [Trichonephila clavipes]